MQSKSLQELIVLKLKDLNDHAEILPKIMSLSIDFSGGENITDDKLIAIVQPLMKCSKLTTLSLNFSHCSKVTDAAMSKVIAALPDLVALTELELNLDHCAKLTTKCFTARDRSQSKMCLAREENHLLGGAIASMEELKSLKLSFRHNDILSDAAFIGLADGIQELEKLESLYIDISECKSLTNAGGIELFGVIGKLENLRKLTIILEGGLVLNKDALSVLNEAFVHLTNLKSLVLNANNNNYINNELLSHQGDKSGLFGLFGIFSCMAQRDKIDTFGLSKSISTMHQLETLDLSFFNEQVTDNAVDSLSEALINLANDLKDLRIDLSGAFKVTEKYLSETVATVSKYQKLRKLKIDFTNRNDISDELVKAYCSATEKFNLVEVHFSFRGCSKISDSIAEYLAKAIQSQKNPEVLAVELEGTSMTDEGLSKISKSLSNITSLKSFTLNISRTFAGDDTLNNLSTSLLHLTDLEELDLNLSYVSKVSGKGVTNLGESFLKLNKVNTCSLNLGHLNKLSDGCFLILGTGIAAMKPLTNLNIDTSNTPISDKGIGSLTNNFHNIVHLADLIINVSGCENLGDAGLAAICHNAGQLKTLRKLFINISESKQISPEGFENALKDLVLSTCLSQLEVKASGTRLTKEAIANAAYALHALDLVKLRISN